MPIVPERDAFALLHQSGGLEDEGDGVVTGLDEAELLGAGVGPAQRIQLIAASAGATPATLPEIRVPCPDILSRDRSGVPARSEEENGHCEPVLEVGRVSF